MNNLYLVIHFGSRIHAIAQWSVSFLGDRCAIEDVRLLHSPFAFFQFRHLRFLLLHYSLHFSLAFCWLWFWVFGGYFLWKMIPRLVRRNPRLRTDPRLIRLSSFSSTTGIRGTLCIFGTFWNLLTIIVLLLHILQLFWSMQRTLRISPTIPPFQMESPETVDSAAEMALIPPVFCE